MTRSSSGRRRSGVEVERLRTRQTDSAGALGVTNGSNNRKDNNASKDVYARVGRCVRLPQDGAVPLLQSRRAGAGSQRHRASLSGPTSISTSGAPGSSAQFLANYDSNPTARGEGFWFYGGFVEGNYRLTPHLLALLRTDHAWAPEFDDRAAGGTTNVQPWTLSVTAGVQFLLDENVKLIVEGYARRAA